MSWYCIDCKTAYQVRTESGFCNAPNCDGMGSGVLKRAQIEESVKEPVIKSATSDPLKEVGICVLLMDASGSMDSPAFPNDPDYSDVTRREIVARSAAAGIFQLSRMTKIDDAYVCAIRFDNTQHHMFTDTVANIIKDHGDAPKFADYLLSELEQMNGTTDINGALAKAKTLVDRFLDGSLKGLGNYLPFYHRGHYCNYVSKVLNIPNVRVLIYTDGENSFGPIDNPFRNDEPDILMGVYIGDPSDAGSKQLQQIVSKCPIHGKDQFFAVDTPEGMSTLRGIFRMASGTSGFCEVCQKI